MVPFGPGVEVGLTPNFMKDIHIFPLSIVGSFFFFFLPSKLMCNAWSQSRRNKTKFCFKTLLNLCSIWTPIKLVHEKETHSSKCCESFLQGFGVLSNNNRKKKAKDICVKHLAISCCMLVYFMAMAQKKICNTIEMWKQFTKFKE